MANCLLSEWKHYKSKNRSLTVTPCRWRGNKSNLNIVLNQLEVNILLRKCKETL